MEEIKNKTNLQNMSIVHAELGSFDQVKEMVKHLHDTNEKIDVLINNAGVLKPNRSLTQEGLEESFAVNYVAPFLLTNLLIDLLKQANSSKIINVVSQVHSNHLDFDNLQFKTGYSGVKAYALSKTCLIMFTYLLAEKLKDSNITVNCLHPGVINTKLLKTAWGTFGDSPEVGAEAIIYLVRSPEIESSTGKYFKNNKPQHSKNITYNKDLQEKLWNKTEDLLGMNFSDH